MSDPTIGEQVATLFQQYRAACEAHQAALAALRGDERRIFGGEEYMLSIKDYNVDHDLCKVGKETADRLIDHASRRFAPGSARLEIDRHAIYEKFGNGGEYANVDLAALWADLEATYGGEKGAEEAYRQTATELVHQFDLSHRAEIERKSGYVVLNLTVWIDSFDKKHSNTNKLSYDSVQRVMEACRTLATFADWAERHNLAGELRSGAARWWNNKVINSRERLGFGDKGCEVEIVTYSSRFEFRICNALAEQLQVFISTYNAAAMLREAA